MGQDKFIMKTSGFALYLFLFMILVCIFLLYVVFKDTMQNGLSLAKIFLFVLFGWGVIIMYRFITSQKIEINENELIASSIFTKKLVLFPKVHTQKINLKDAGAVAVARRRYFEERALELKDKGLGNLIDTYRNLYSVIVNRGVVLPVPLGFATRNMPLMFVAPKDKSQKGIAATMEPFSKGGLRNLIRELQKRNIPVFTDPTLGLMPNDPPFLHDRVNKNIVVGLSGTVIFCIVFFITGALKDKIPSGSPAVLIFPGSLGLAISSLAYGFTGKIKSALKVMAVWVLIIVALVVWSYIK